MKGVFTALITPFLKDGSIDWKAFDELLKTQGDARVHGVVPCGTTGESPTLYGGEKKKLIERCIHAFKGSPIQVIAGTGSNNTQETVELSKWASQAGAQAVLVVTPYYNKPTPEGLFQHYQAVNEAVDCGIVPYNVPGRTGVSFDIPTILRVAGLSHVVSIKEATGNIEWDQEILEELHHHKKKMTLLSGDDPTFLPFLNLGGHGIISVSSNLIPKTMIQIYEKKEPQLFLNHVSLFKNLFIESNPGPIKYALAKKMKWEETMRLPLVPITETSRRILNPILEALHE